MAHISPILQPLLLGRAHCLTQLGRLTEGRGHQHLTTSHHRSIQSEIGRVAVVVLLNLCVGKDCIYLLINVMLIQTTCEQRVAILGNHRLNRLLAIAEEVLSRTQFQLLFDPAVDIDFEQCGAILGGRCLRIDRLHVALTQFFIAHLSHHTVVFERRRQFAARPKDYEHADNEQYFTNSSHKQNAKIVFFLQLTHFHTRLLCARGLRVDFFDRTPHHIARRN